MPAVVVDSVLESIRECAFKIAGETEDFDPLLDMIGDAQFVLLGEASHGTHEFYRTRAQLTRRLIEEKNFNAVAVEADWPDAYRVNHFVRHTGDDPNAERALAGFQRFPTWMWRNSDVVEFIEWLRIRNASLDPKKRAGFYGLDLYSLNASIEAVLKYLDKVDPEAAKRARHRYACFEHYGEDTQGYGYAASVGLTEPCERYVVNQLVEMQRKAMEFERRGGRMGEDEFFFAEQNARLVKNAEEYYRSMFRGRVDSWNLRDRHMVETLRALVAHLDRDVKRPKIVLWAHNSHLGDARATQMTHRGEWNVGQLLRERYGGAAVLIGFTTFSGTVTAASDWGAPAERKRVRRALADSYERLFHETELGNFYLLLKNGEVSQYIRRERLERAIGVIYLPESERISHYFDAFLPGQFDAVIHFDETSAVEPLEPTAQWVSGESPETFPSGI
ncbi:MAG TPA: erythromycin esterase family protein [Verrucomicrobiae bacterium]|nr:erythromycin esterase family protein [Verrucomicrobiae bacterium]